MPVVAYAKKTGAVISIEEQHSVIGGLGSAVAECLSEKCPTPLKQVGINDSFGESGNYNDLLNKFELTAPYIMAAAKKLLGKAD